MAKADASSVALYAPNGSEIVRYARSWRRGHPMA